MAGPLPAIPRTQSPSPDAVEAWNAVAAVQREADDHAATLASSRRHKARVMPAPRLGCPQPVASGMVVEVAKLLQPTSPCVRLTSEEVSERNRQKRQNGIAITTWRRRTSSTPVLPANGETFSIWIEQYSSQLVSLITSLPYPLMELYTWGRSELFKFGQSICCSSQLALIDHHSMDQNLEVRLRSMCQRRAIAIRSLGIIACRWKLTNSEE
uniref:Uncharacterized protein n=1 Tax=Peronospora matthiolae TaxID=2874970 RepID=A0AAV1T1J9_9STRA